MLLSPNTKYESAEREFVKGDVNSPERNKKPVQTRPRVKKDCEEKIPSVFNTKEMPEDLSALDCF